MHEKLKWTLICVLIINPNIELLLSDLHCTMGKFHITSYPKSTAGLLSGNHPGTATSKVFSLVRHVRLCLLKVEGVWCSEIHDSLQHLDDLLKVHLFYSIHFAHLQSASYS